MTKVDYQKTDQYAVTAYLDNYEYLESPIEKHDSKLKSYIEIQMREGLRQMLTKKAPPQSVTTFVSSLLLNLDKAKSLLKNDTSQQAPINQLETNAVLPGSNVNTNKIINNGNQD